MQTVFTKSTSDDDTRYATNTSTSNITTLNLFAVPQYVHMVNNKMIVRWNENFNNGLTSLLKNIPVWLQHIRHQITLVIVSLAACSNIISLYMFLNVIFDLILNLAATWFLLFIEIEKCQNNIEIILVAFITYWLIIILFVIVEIRIFLFVRKFTSNSGFGCDHTI